ncbi:hypothetical protein [Pseudonocardia acidicola]|uniref:MYXO-CTERM domain-containing protein n=1 Tax=Pseudonocardia acidicola TaxID=2724939 RepID=A0ABX1S870_9PSEU|nr:hypothetical protein [Pseudonocardia acidicola]NMH97751.1 hypothetical protein [Pseudonocardia acidicola]
MIERLSAFGRFVVDFVVGDDWLVAVVVVLGLGVTAVLARAGVPAWWVLPAAVALVLPLSLWRATRRR